MLPNTLFPIDMSIWFYFICDVIADNITLDSCEISHKYLSFSVLSMAILWFRKEEIRIKEKQYFSEKKIYEKSVKRKIIFMSARQL